MTQRRIGPVMAPEFTTHAEYEYPGPLPLTVRYDTRIAADRDPAKALREAPRGALAFRFYDTLSVAVMVGGKKVTLTADEDDDHVAMPSGRYYIGAAIISRAACTLITWDDGYSARPSAALAAMRDNDWKHVVRCRDGSLRPYMKKDALILENGIVMRVQQ